MAIPTFSTAWTASTKARKQRKFRHNAPLHLRSALMCAHLSKALRQQYKRRAVPVRTGDQVKVVRGSFAGKTGTIERKDLHKLTVFITGIDHTKRDGSKHMIPINPSNLIIQELDLKDRRRIDTISKKAPAEKTAKAAPRAEPTKTSGPTATPKKPAAKAPTLATGASAAGPARKEPIAQKP